MERAASQLSQAFSTLDSELLSLERSTDMAFTSATGNLNPKVLEQRLDDLVEGASQLRAEMLHVACEKQRVWSEIQELVSANREKVVAVQDRLMMEVDGYPDHEAIRKVGARGKGEKK